MSPDDFAAWLAEEALTGWQGGPETAMTWAQTRVNATYLPSRDGIAPVSAPVSAASIVFECWARSDLRTMGRVSDALAEELLSWLDDWGCDLFARSLVLRAAMEGWPLPGILYPFARENIGRKSRYGSKGERYWKISARNHIGAQILAVLTHGFGVRPTRNVASKQTDSACDILAEATRGASWAAFTYSKAAEVWKNRARLWKELEVMSRVKQFWEPPLCLPPMLARGFLAELSAADDSL